MPFENFHNNDATDGFVIIIIIIIIIITQKSWPDHESECASIADSG